MSLGPNGVPGRAAVRQTHQCGERPEPNPIVVKTTTSVTRRNALAALGSAATAAAIGFPRPARAATPVRFLTNWFAEAEHGGFYQAQATGLYAKAGLDVSIMQGSPQVNSVQLLAGGDADFIIGWDMQTLANVEKGVPIVAVASTFQFELQCIDTHPNVASLADLRGHTILVSSEARTTYWPWLAARYGYTDDQAQPYPYTYQRFMSDPTIAEQGFITYDGYALKKAGVPAKLFLLADQGYPAYGSPIITTRAYLAHNHDVVERFLRASMEGWKSYLRDPAPANALIVAANPKMPVDQIAATIDTLRSIHALDRGDAATLGIGCMTDARWRKTRDVMVRSKLLDPATDWRAAYSTDICNRLHVLA